MEFSELVHARHSVRRYQPDAVLTDAELCAIFDQVRYSPSSFNMQHWRFVVVRDPARKRALRDLSFGQAQVEQCAAVVLVCGRLDAYEDAPRIYAEAPADLRDKVVPSIGGVYRDKPALQREECVRSGALAAMTLMYAAKNRGWDSGPMIGFDATKVSALLELDATTIPVMMVTVGKALNGEQPPRLYRRPLSEIVSLETATGAGLGA
jgi:nitroreductase